MTQHFQAQNEQGRRNDVDEVNQFSTEVHAASPAGFFRNMASIRSVTM